MLQMGALRCQVLSRGARAAIAKSHRRSSSNSRNWSFTLLEAASQGADMVRFGGCLSSWGAGGQPLTVSSRGLSSVRQEEKEEPAPGRVS